MCRTHRYHEEKSSGIGHRRRYPFVALGLVLLFAVWVGACTSQGSLESTSAPIQLLKANEFADYIDNNPEVALINVHIPYAGHIETTDEFVPFDAILNWENLPDDADTPIAIYCRSGSMSGEAAEALAEAGYTNIIDLDGGMNAWTASGRSLVEN